jgi:hypothetical protein
VGYVTVPPGAPRVAVQAKAPNIGVAGRMVDPSGSHTTFGVTVGGSPNTISVRDRLVARGVLIRSHQ